MHLMKRFFVGIPVRPVLSSRSLSLYVPALIVCCIRKVFMQLYASVYVGSACIKQQHPKTLF